MQEKDRGTLIKVIKDAVEIDNTVVQEATWQIDGQEVKFRFIETNNNSNVLIWNQEGSKWVSTFEANQKETELIKIIEDICEFEDIDDFIESDKMKWNGEDMLYI